MSIEQIYEEHNEAALERFDEMPKSQRMYYEYLLALYPRRKRVSKFALPVPNGIMIDWVITGYDQTQDEYGKYISKHLVNMPSRALLIERLFV